MIHKGTSLLIQSKEREFLILWKGRKLHVISVYRIHVIMFQYNHLWFENFFLFLLNFFLISTYLRRHLIIRYVFSRLLLHVSIQEEDIGFKKNIDFRFLTDICILKSLTISLFLENLAPWVTVSTCSWHKCYRRSNSWTIT